MERLLQLLDVRDRSYSEWKAYIPELKKKYTGRRNSPDIQKQQEASTCLSAIGYIDNLLESIPENSEWTTLAVKVILDYCENGDVDDAISQIVGACEGDEHSIRSISKSIYSEQIKREWDRSIGRGIIKPERKPKDDTTVQFGITYVLPSIAALTPVLFLITVFVMSHTASFIEENERSGMSPFDFIKPMIIFIVIRYIIFVILRVQKRLNPKTYTVSIIMTIINLVVSFLLLKLPAMKASLDAWSGAGSARRFFLFYLIVATIIWGYLSILGRKSR